MEFERCEGLAPVSDLVRVLDALRDTTERNGWFAAAEEASELASYGFSTDACKANVSREEFLGAMCAAYNVVGHRAFVRAIHLELKAATHSNLRPRRCNGDLVPPSLHQIDDASLHEAAPATPSAQGAPDSPTSLYIRRAMRAPTISFADEVELVTRDQNSNPSAEQAQLSSTPSGTFGLGLRVTPTPRTLTIPDADELEEASEPLPWRAPVSRPASAMTTSEQRYQNRIKTRSNLAHISCDALSVSLLQGSGSGQLTAPPSPVYSQRSEHNTPRCFAQVQETCLSARCARAQQGHSTTSQVQVQTDNDAANRGCEHGASKAQLLRLGSEAVSTSASTAPSALRTPSPSNVADFEKAERRSCSSSMSHHLSWQLPEETLIIFDWDDTLCPTSFIHEDTRLDWSERAQCFSDPSILLNESSAMEAFPEHEDLNDSMTLDSALQRHADVAIDCLQAAVKLGKVFIVTLAKEGWVELSAKNFLPGLYETIVDLGIQIVYARDCLPRWKLRCAALDELDVLQLMKQTAMSQCIKRLYSARPKQSWKNLISIGDSEVERHAMTELCFCRYQPDKNDLEKPCRCKTVKLPEDPDLLQLTAELELILGWIQPIVLYDGDVDLNLIDSDSAIPMLERVLAGLERPDTVKSEFAVERTGL